MIGLFILVCFFVMHCMMSVMVVMHCRFLVMTGLIPVGHRHPRHS